MGSSARTRRRLTGVLVVWWVCLAQLATANTCREDTVNLKGDWGQARFSVEIADTIESRARGLMHRTQMPKSSGMLFVYDRPQVMSFWMRNTLIPLDMIFVDPTGEVQHVHHNAIPLDETPILGGEGLTHVLEINGGLSARLGIAAGTVLRHPSFSQDAAQWPC